MIGKTSIAHSKEEKPLGELANKFLGVAAAASKKFGVGSAIAKLKAGVNKTEKDEAKVEGTIPAE